MGYGVGHRTYHTVVIKGPVTKKIGEKTPIMIDEATLALDDLFGKPEGTPLSILSSISGSNAWGTEYTPFPLYDHMAMTVARIVNRIYVGTQFCKHIPSSYNIQEHLLT